MSDAAENLPLGIGRADKLRCLVVDDSAIVRGLIVRILEADDMCEVVATANTGKAAVAAVRRHRPDIALLDVEMPEMDGLTALPLMLEAAPSLRIVMVSATTRSGAQTTFKALELGAMDCIAKPTASGQLNNRSAFGNDLMRIVRGLHDVRPSPPQTGSRIAREQTASSTPAKPSLTDRQSRHSPAGASFDLRPRPPIVPSVIAMGSSTGGPHALVKVLSALPETVRQPIVITQHMPPTFTGIFAQNLEKASGRPASEGDDGERLEAGRIYVAPGGIHMTVEGRDEHARIRLDDGPPENFCKPAVDPMFRSIANGYGSAAVGVVLTGMGSDGCAGAEAMVAAGAGIIGQDRETSTVWGMPAAVAEAGLCYAILPLEKIATEIASLCGSKEDGL